MQESWEKMTGAIKLIITIGAMLVASVLWLVSLGQEMDSQQNKSIHELQMASALSRANMNNLEGKLKDVRDSQIREEATNKRVTEILETLYEETKK